VEATAVTDSLTRWVAPHPAWTPNPEWPEEVAFATWESRDSYVFIDPLVRDDLDPAPGNRLIVQSLRQALRLSCC
jgi:hypothetical protein